MRLSILDATLELGSVIVNVTVVLLAVGFGLVLAAFGAFLVVTGFRVVSRGFREWSLARRSRTWSQADATITSCRVVRTGMGRSTRHVPRVEYTFETGGRSYDGRRIAFSTETGGGYVLRDEAQQIADRYAEGTQVVVFYDPDDPRRATLERNRPGLYEPLVFFVILVGVGSALLPLGIDVAINAVTKRPPIATD